MIIPSLNIPMLFLTFHQSFFQGLYRSCKRRERHILDLLYILITSLCHDYKHNIWKDVLTCAQQCILVNMQFHKMIFSVKYYFSNFFFKLNKYFNTNNNIYSVSMKHLTNSNIKLKNSFTLSPSSKMSKFDLFCNISMTIMFITLCYIYLTLTWPWPTYMTLKNCKCA